MSRIGALVDLGIQLQLTAATPQRLTTAGVEVVVAVISIIISMVIITEEEVEVTVNLHPVAGEITATRGLIGRDPWKVP